MIMITIVGEAAVGEANNHVPAVLYRLLSFRLCHAQIIAMAQTMTHIMMMRTKCGDASQKRNPCNEESC